MNAPEKEEAVTLEILSAIEEKSDLSQRHIADRLGLALGLANSYLKRCVRKGLIKMHHAPANRYLYYLTPKGFAEKSRLTAQYLIVSFDLYRKAGESFVRVFEHCGARGHDRVLLAGVSELAEIASLRAHDHAIRIVGTYDPASRIEQFLKLSVWSDLQQADEFDVCLLTDMTQPAPRYEDLIEKIGPERVLIPSVLAGAVPLRGRRSFGEAIRFDLK
ncbi:MAG: winged helix-turn-helix transcriptional regulator [Gammaproteobacteria bacterium]